MHGVSPELLAGLVFGILVLGFALASRALARRLVTAPLAFVAAGAVLGFLADPIDRESLTGLKLVAELTLVLILFHDAAQVRPREIGDDRWAIVRLLVIGFPLTVLLGCRAGSNPERRCAGIARTRVPAHRRTTPRVPAGRWVIRLWWPFVHSA